MSARSCPSTETLRNWALGDLPDDQADVVLQHLDVCEICERSVAGIKLPHLIGAFQADNDFRAEKECEELIAALSGGPGPTSPTPVSMRPADLSGLQIRDYQLIEQLGRGGMGTVYLARHLRLHKLVAIKLVPEHSNDDPTAVTRFEREMQAVGSLDHPNLVRALDAGDVDGLYFIVMELMDGNDVSRLMRDDQKLSIADGCEIIRQAAVGMQYAHDLGLIHRDLKPSNLMLTRDPDDSACLKVLDLGLALMPEADESITALTDPRLLIGTLEYMAPEQAVGSDAVDQRADIYSLGVTLFRLLTGGLPFRGPGFRKPAIRLLALTTAEAPGIATRRADLPADLVRLVDQMLCRNPEGRPSSMSCVAEGLAPFCVGANLEKLLPEVSQHSAEVSGTLVVDEVAPAGAIDDTAPGGELTVIQNRAPAVPSPHTVAARDVGSDGGSGRFKWLALAAALPLSILAAVIWLKTDGGYIRVEHDDDIELTLQVVKDGVPIGEFELRQAKDEVFYRSGHYEFRIPRDRQDTIHIANGEFSLERNGRHVVKISRAARPKTMDVPVSDVSVSDISIPPVPQKKGPMPPSAVVPFDGQQAVQLQQAWADYWNVPIEYENSIGMKFRLIPPGEFLMGSSDNEYERAMTTRTEPRPSRMNMEKEAILIQSEAPRRRVQLTHPFYMGTFEVREREYDQLATRKKPLKVQSPDHPMGLVSWQQAALFCNELSRRESMTPRYEIDRRDIKILAQARGYRLPTEAEWEFACRAGSVSQFPFGDDPELCDQHGWFGAAAGVEGNPTESFSVGQKKANSFGLFDILGNHWEWCEDADMSAREAPEPWVNPMFHELTRNRIGRGGFVLSIPDDLRSARRRSHAAHMPYPHGGFRVVLVPGSDDVRPDRASR